MSAAAVIDGRAGIGGRNRVPWENAGAIQRTRLIAATIEAVEAVGYEALTVGDIVGRARVSRKTFYDVFVDREECFCAALEYVVDQAAAILGEAYRGKKTWRESMRAGLRELFRLIEENPGLARLCVVDCLTASDGVARTRARVLARIADVIDRGRERDCALGEARGTAENSGSRDGRSGGSSEGTGGPDRASERSEGEAPAAIAEGIVGGLFTIIHGWLLNGEGEPLAGRFGACMYLVVVGYEGRGAGSEELGLAGAEGLRVVRRRTADRVRPLADLQMRLTYRTIRVLGAISDSPGACNREVAARAGVGDQGQMSKLLGRIAEHGLVENRGVGGTRRAGNAWHLTRRGAEVLRTTQPAGTPTR